MHKACIKKKKKRKKKAFMLSAKKVLVLEVNAEE